MKHENVMSAHSRFGEFKPALLLSLAFLCLSSAAYAGGKKTLAVKPGPDHVGPSSVFIPGEVKVQPPGSNSTPPAPISYIEPCCASIPSGVRNIDRDYDIQKNTDHADPYTTGPTKLPRESHPVQRGRDYVYSAPTWLGGPKQIEAQLAYQIPSQKRTESIDTYNQRRLREVLNLKPGTPISSVTTEVGHGSQSYVFMIHDPLPGDAELKKLYPDDVVKQRFQEGDPSYARRFLWASSHSQEVIKVRTPTPWNKTLEEAARQARRDIALTDVFEECADHFRAIESGNLRPLIEVVRYTNAHHELEQGMFRQPTVNGDTAYKIAIKIAQAKQGNADALRYLKEEMRFKSVEEAEHKIRLLEAFYEETHFDVIGFESTNKIPMMAGHVRVPYSHEQRIRTVGFDYNLGQNAMWDPKAQVFKAVDF